MTKEEINQLAERIVSGLATEEEILLYHQVCEFVENSAIDSVENSIGDKAKLQSDMQNAIWARTKSRKRVIKLPGLKWAAAAAVLIMLGLSSYFLFSKKDGTRDVVETSPKKDTLARDILAGGNKATLTLADGTKIILDSTENGTITQVGGVQVIKLSNGKLIYDPKNAKPGEVLYNTISTPEGGQYHLVLADGSKIWLNAASSLRFPSFFIGNERSVELNGEGYFEISRNASMPFHVIVNDMKVEVLGTHFNINSYEDEESIKTTLLEGSVRVYRLDRNEVLKPGEQVVFDVSTNRMQKNQNVDIDEVIAWKEGRFKFKKMSIEDIMRQVARWYNVEIEYNGKITTDFFSGDVSRQEDVTQLLEILAATKTVSFKLEGKKIIVNSK